MSRTVVVAYIALGANLDDPVRQVRQAIDRLQTIPQCQLAAASSLWRTAPVGGALVAGQPDYINAVAKLETTLDAEALLQQLHAHCCCQESHRRGCQGKTKRGLLQGELPSPPRLEPHQPLCATDQSDLLPSFFADDPELNFQEHKQICKTEGPR